MDRSGSSSCLAIRCVLLNFCYTFPTFIVHMLVRDESHRSAGDVFNHHISHLTVLDEAGTRTAVVHVAAGVVEYVPLAAPLTGHT